MHTLAPGTCVHVSPGSQASPPSQVRMHHAVVGSLGETTHADPSAHAPYRSPHRAPTVRGGKQ